MCWGWIRRLPEGTEERTIQAANQIIGEGFLIPCQGLRDYFTNSQVTEQLKLSISILHTSMDAIDMYMQYFQENYTWGYSTPYFIAGMYCCHVNNIAYLLKNPHSGERYT